MIVADSIGFYRTEKPYFLDAWAKADPSNQELVDKVKKEMDEYYRGEK